MVDGRIFLILAHAMAGLVTLAITRQNAMLFLAMMGSIAVGSLGLYLLFRDRPLFAASFAGLAAVYASVFAFFLEDVFGHVAASPVAAGFAMPIASFLTGCWWRHDDIRRNIGQVQEPDEAGLERSALWLLPVFAVGLVVIALSAVTDTVYDVNIFLAAMAVIGAIVLVSSRRIALFLIEVALLFEQFTSRISRLALPAFAFLTVYAFIVIVFAAIYSIISNVGGTHHFRVFAEARALSFPEALHFSIVTLSTVGYGDVVPASNVMRALASFEVVCGVLLLLFGFSELIEYARAKDREKGKN